MMYISFLEFNVLKQKTNEQWVAEDNAIENKTWLYMYEVSTI